MGTTMEIENLRPKSPGKSGLKDNNIPNIR
jgi:hypothetical protein